MVPGSLSSACGLQAEWLHSWPWQESLKSQKPRSPGATFDSKRGLQRLWQALASRQKRRRGDVPQKSFWGTDADGGEHEVVATDGLTEPGRERK